ncbi:MAG: 1,4-dihydroxy-6-naphthoate synthase, partial [Thermodesulfovibrionales bacterium]
SIGYSPCPNDTFIFYALMHGKVFNESYRFDQIFEDVETLNRMALESRLDVAKISYHALGHIRDEYCLLRSGGALGKGCGPLVIARNECDMSDLAGKRIAVPGRYTTAFLLLKLYDPVFGDNVVFMPFDRIMETVKEGEADAGLIIHESRFTYELYGLKEVIDLGQWWESKTGLPIPLGAIVARRTLGEGVIADLDSMIRSSIDYAYSHREETIPYIKNHSQEMSDEVIDKHIGLYVNEFSLDIGEEGEKAIKALIDMAEGKEIFKANDVSLFRKKDSGAC